MKRSPQEGTKQLTFHWHAYSVLCVCLYWMVGCFYLPLIERIKKEKEKGEEGNNTYVIAQCIFERL